MIEKRSKLGESQTLQQFSRDVDEIEAWISEKLQTATDESYKDPTNIQVHVVSTGTARPTDATGGTSIVSYIQRKFIWRKGLHSLDLMYLHYLG